MTVERAAEIISGHMDEIVGLFKPGAKIAILVRSPGHPDRDFMMTDDSIEELEQMLARRKAKKP